MGVNPAEYGRARKHSPQRVPSRNPLEAWWSASYVLLCRKLSQSQTRHKERPDLRYKFDADVHDLSSLCLSGLAQL